MFSLQNKTSLVTGAGSGIGAAIAETFARAGAKVFVADRDEKSGRAAAEKIGGEFLLLDVSNEVDCASAAKISGPLDVLVNNAGTTRFIDHANLDALTNEVWDEILGVNLKGTFFCCRAALPHLQKTGGSIVNVTSVAGLQGHGSSIPYAASKAAVNCMTKSLARAFGPTVRVNAVAPGPVLTRWLAEHMDHVARSLSITPMGRAAIPDDIADAVCFLALGTNLMTGQVMVVDGGRTM